MMDSSEEDDPGLLDAVKDSLRRQIVELQRRIQDQRERNLTTDLMLRDAYDQAKTKHILKALKLKRQLKDVEMGTGEGRRMLSNEACAVENLIDVANKHRIDSLRWRLKELTKIQRLFTPTPFVYRNLIGRSRYHPREEGRLSPFSPLFPSPRPSPTLEESTSQDPDTPFISRDEDATYEQIPTTPESVLKSADRLEGLLQEVEGKVAGLYKVVVTKTEDLRRKLKEVDGSFVEESWERDGKQGLSIEMFDPKNPTISPISPDTNPRNSSIPLFEITSLETRSVVDPVEGDEEVTFRWSPGESVLGLATQEAVEEDTEDQNRLAVLNSSLVARTEGRQVRGEFVRVGLANQGDQSSPELTIENISCDQLLHSEEEQNQSHLSATPSSPEGLSTSHKTAKPRPRVWRCLFCPCFGKR